MPGTITEIVRPNGNNNALWNIYDYTNIDDNVIYPAVPGADNIEADKDDDNETQRYNCQNPTGDFETADQLEFYIYTGTQTDYPTAYLIINGVPTKFYQLNATNTWFKFTYSGSWTKTQLNALVIAFLSPNLPSTAYVQIRCAYVKIFGVLTAYPISYLKKGLITGYNCFIKAYIDAMLAGYTPLKNPNGTPF